MERSPLRVNGSGEKMLYRRILVSCGQETHDEINVARDIIAAIGKRRGMEGFFTQDTHSPEDLNRAVFEALKTCDGFFAVMHKRGGITYRNYPVVHRSSVWMQQAIAILCYRMYLQGAHVPTRVYAEKGILLEGLMKNSVVNPIPFGKREEVLEGLAVWLDGPEFQEHPVTVRRHALFQRRAGALNEHHWLILELIAAHSAEAGDEADAGEAARDFLEIFTAQGESDQGILKVYGQACESLVQKGLLLSRYESATGKQFYSIPKRWWDLVLQELRNQGRM